MSVPLNPPSAEMSLRDFFAAYAVGHFLAGHTLEDAASVAYALADALLVERSHGVDGDGDQ